MSIVDLNFIRNLNSKQQEAVQSSSFATLILAGAGSGKTRVITSKIIHLLSKSNYHPSNILAVTFTNKAAKEMYERITKAKSFFEQYAHNANMFHQLFWIHTFHALGCRILRQSIGHLGYSSSFSIYDRQDSYKIIKTIAEEQMLQWKSTEIKNCLQEISKTKQVQSLSSNIDSLSEKQDFLKVYNEYERRLKLDNALDFDDLIAKTIQLFQEQPEILKTYQKQFKYILVDEFQDTNWSQYHLLSLLKNSNSGIMAVGDDDQSIYSWRGGNPGHMMEFLKDFKATLIKLEQNYRSSQIILQVANSLIKKNSGRIGKTLWSKQTKGGKILFFEGTSEHDELNWITQNILQLSSLHPMQEIAILYRGNFQSRSLEAKLLQSKIPYQIYGNIEFLQRQEVKDILAFFKIILNLSDSLSLQRILNIPKRGIGILTKKKLHNFQLSKNISSCLEAIMLATQEEKLFNAKHKKALLEFCSLINAYRDIVLNKKMGLFMLFQKLCKDLQYSQYLESQYENHSERLENLKELGRGIYEYEENHPECSLQDYLIDISLAEETQAKQKGTMQANGVQLMTLHKSKGLEFNCVFITGLNMGLLPHYRHETSPEDIEEERRLFYVGLTRARQQCFLSAAQSRFMYGYIQKHTPSIFIKELDAKLIEHVNLHNSKILGENQHDYNI